MLITNMCNILLVSSEFVANNDINKPITQYIRYLGKKFALKSSFRCGVNNKASITSTKKPTNTQATSTHHTTPISSIKHSSSTEKPQYKMFTHTINT